MFRLLVFVAGLLCLMLPVAGHAEEAKPAPDFHKVYELVREHLVDAKEPELNRAAVRGFVSALNPRVMLLDESSATNGSSPVGVTRSNIFEKGIAYLRLERLAAGSDQQLKSCLDTLGTSNRIAGVVLDLRFASGDDYDAAAAVADLFQSTRKPLLNAGKGMLESKAKDNAITVPAAVLVNRQTASAPEALAAVLRQTGTCLILGERTAGKAMIAKDFPLDNGEQLRIATSQVQLGNGSALDFGGVIPDIEVPVEAKEELKYYADAFYLAPSGSGQSALRASAGTNAASRRVRVTEADLVRERREGSGQEEIRARKPELDLPVVSDPALARALDLLKGLAVIRRAKS